MFCKVEVCKVERHETWRNMPEQTGTSQNNLEQRITTEEQLQTSGTQLKE